MPRSKWLTNGTLANEVKLHYNGTQINGEVDFGVLDYSQKRWHPVHMVPSLRCDYPYRLFLPPSSTVLVLYMLTLLIGSVVRPYIEHFTKSLVESPYLNRFSCSFHRSIAHAVLYLGISFPR